MRYSSATWKTFHAMVEICVEPQRGQQEIAGKLITEYGFRFATVGQVNYIMSRTRHDPVFGGKFKWGTRGLSDSGYTFIKVGASVTSKDQSTIQDDIIWMKSQSDSLLSQCQMLADGVPDPVWKSYWQKAAAAVSLVVDILEKAA